MKSNAMHIDPVPPALSSSMPSLSELIATDSVPGVFAFLMDEAIVENPDARLKTFTDVAAHLNTRCTGDLDSSAATSLDSPLTPASSESGSPLDASRWKWADVLMRGVTDPWSRIRAICLSPMADLLLSEVRDRITQHHLCPSELPHPSLAERACPVRSHPESRRHSTGKAEKQETASEAARQRRRSLEKNETHALSSAAASGADVSSPLGYVWRYWANTTHWYEHDGIVRLLVKVYGRCRTPSCAALRGDNAGIHTLLSTVLFPAFRDPQLPVRESAAALLGVLVDRDRSPPISPTITSFIVDHVCDTLTHVPIPRCNRSPLTPGDQENTRVLEGHLLALLILVDMNVSQAADTSIMPLLLRLASYPASSVRQYIAQILRPPSPKVFVYLMEQLCEHDGQKPHRSEMDLGDDDDEEESELNWQRQETVMMALNQHLLSITAVRATAHDWLRASARSDSVLEMMRSAAPLSVVFRAMHSPRFEIARMGLQIFPLLLQSCVRFLAPGDLPCILEACCGPNGCVQRELNSLQAQGATKMLAQAQLSVATVVMPALWFFVAIRRIEAEVSRKSAGVSRLRASSSGSPAEVEEVIRPYATLERIAFASQPHLSHDSTPCVASTCALLPLAAYFARVMDPAEWLRCVEEVLKPSWWVDLLSNAVRREQVRYGPDFVRTVHRCGTPEQSQRLVELIPTLAAALATAQTHQQCLLIAMIQVAVSARVGSTGLLDERVLAFVYHDVYAAPALTEGGEATPLGHTWLKLYAPTQDALPTALLWGRASDTEQGNASTLVLHRNSEVFRALEAVCFRDLYQSTKTELSVLRELRSLMMSLTRLGVQESGDVDWYAVALESVFGRLDKVCPRWREMANENASGDDDGAAKEGEEEAEKDEVCWDDWDDDEEDADGCAQGIYEAEAIKSAIATVSTLRDWVMVRSGDSGRAKAADERFHVELAALNIK